MTAAAPASAYDRDFGHGWTLDWNSRVSMGAAMRMQGRSDSLVGKQNLNPGLCAADDCLSLDPSNTAPAARFNAAPGAASSFYDDGDLNYSRHDIVAAGTKFTTHLDFGTPEHGISLGALAFYDPVNDSFRERHPNLLVEDGPQPGGSRHTQRSSKARDDVGVGVQLQDANVYAYFDGWADQTLEVRLGRQILNWGEAALPMQGTINVVNPPNLNNVLRPGVELQDLLKPVNMLLLRGPLAGSWSFEAFYQLEWRPYGLAPDGAYLSTFDGGNRVEFEETQPALFARSPDDPGLRETPANDALARISASSFSIARSHDRNPSDSGQFGFALYTTSDDTFTSPVNLGFYFARYHSRLPIVGATAAQASCTRREGNASGNDAATAAEFEADCGVPGLALPGADFEALPIDTARYFFEYPEAIHLFGFSLETTALDSGVQLELAFRDNQPIQVDIEDVLFAAMQPAFPRHDIALTTGTMPAGSVLPASTHAIPDFLTAYRGGAPGEVDPGQTIHGYERMKTLNGTLGFTRNAGTRTVLGEDQAVFLFEAQGNYIFDLPSTSRLQFEAPGTDTHHSPGVRETGDGLLFNPRETHGGYVDSLAYGYRLGALLKYNDFWKQGLTLRPLLLFTHDIHGTAPGPVDNFVQGRKTVVASFEVLYREMQVDLTYTWFTGGGNANRLADRDFIGLSLSFHL